VGENPMEAVSIEGTSKIKTLVENLLFATLLELDNSKVNVIKWKRVIEEN
jgi:hypothetical protein